MNAEVREYLSKREMRKLFRILNKAKKRAEKRKEKEKCNEKSVLFFNCQFASSDDGRTDYQCWKNMEELLDQILKHCKKKGCPYADTPTEGIDEEFPEEWI